MKRIGSVTKEPDFRFKKWQVIQMEKAMAMEKHLIVQLSDGKHRIAAQGQNLTGWFVITLLATLAPLSALSQDASATLTPPVRPEIITDCDTPGGYGRLCFPGGLTRALTLSFDDGRTYDYKLVEVLNRCGLRATFHLVSGQLDKPDYVKSADVKNLYSKHEVAAHTVTHPNLAKSGDEVMAYEVMQDRINLEKLVGYPVRGLAYPGGEANEHVADMLPKFGIR